MKLKTIADFFLTDMPGILAAIKVFVTDEMREKVTKRLVTDLRHELEADIAALPAWARKVWEQRLDEAEKLGTEDRLVWNVCKMPRKIRQEWWLEWLANRTPQEFRIHANVLDDDKVHQFVVRLLGQYKTHIAPLLTSFSTVVTYEADELDQKLQPLRDKLRRQAATRGWRSWTDC